MRTLWSLPAPMLLVIVLELVPTLARRPVLVLASSSSVGRRPTAAIA